MRKIFLILSFVLLIITSCEKDDFCLKNPVTPNLVLRFYSDASKETLKNARLLSVWAEGKDTIADYTSVSTDSIAIPLNSLASETIYHLKINNEDGAEADNQYTTFTIKYTPEEKYVSRSCGYQVLFNDVSFDSDNTNWIKDFTPETLTTIDNQNTAHVQIFH
ncbi:DUF6452 family protein [Polaribacter butkevichii]|uniref:SbsA Ig-like domain-containing protein n=1 Tax=Polaribacter butkevichii TaxID=218490 RepID=A0A2P6CC40_9FLAO|nr:DUF6452 family protein [Polaribacter butkevichii]PQJ72418.1 hypothetical protein BTO14_03750 [Polaribacter butkevichii]